MRTSTARWVTTALLLSTIPTLLTAPASPSSAATIRQQRTTYVKRIYALSLPDFLMQERHWQPIQRANNGNPAASHHADWSTDGCSGGIWVWSLLDAEFRGQRWENVFRNACIRHDFGYRNFGKGRLENLAYVSTPAKRKAVDIRLYSEARARCSTFSSRTHINCMAAAAAMYAGVRLGGANAFYGHGCYAHDLCLRSNGSDRSISASTANLGTRWEFNDKATSASNGSHVAWKVFRDADFKGSWTCVPPGATTNLPTRLSSSKISLGLLKRTPVASSALRMAGPTC